MPSWLSPLCLMPGENIQFGIMVFLEVQEINLLGNMRGCRCDEYCIFFMKTFSFNEKVPFPFDPAAFFRNIFTSTPRDVFKRS